MQIEASDKLWLYNGRLSFDKTGFHFCLTGSSPGRGAGPEGAGIAQCNHLCIMGMHNEKPVEGESRRPLARKTVVHRQVSSCYTSVELPLSKWTGFDRH